MKVMFSPRTERLANSSIDQHKIDKPWLDLQYHEANRTLIKKPNELEREMKEPKLDSIDPNILDRIEGSMMGMALGDALGAHVEFRPRSYMDQNPVTDLEGGGTWGLQKGQFTDDTSMALCLANSLVAKCGFSLYDQLVRYKWWYRQGYMSSTGQCFDIGAATSQALTEFERRQHRFAKKHNIPYEYIDSISDEKIINDFNTLCSEDGVAGNGALMRLAPVPLFFFKYPTVAIEYSGRSGQITHGDIKAYDACRYYGALIVAALHGYTKEQLFNKDFYSNHKHWFGGKPLCNEIKLIAEGSYKKPGGYNDGIRGKGYIVNALEAALWAFWSDENSFEKGALAAVNLGDDTDTTAAIYGQLAGAYYGYKKLPEKWVKQVYARKFIRNLCMWIAYEGQMSKVTHPVNLASSNQLYSDDTNTKIYSSHDTGAGFSSNSPQNSDPAQAGKNLARKSLGPTLSIASIGQSTLTPTLSVNYGLLNHSKMDPHTTTQRQSHVTTTEGTIKKSRLNYNPSTIEDSNYSNNLSVHYGKGSQETNQGLLRLSKTYSTPSSDLSVSLTPTTMNQNSLDKYDTNLKLSAANKNVIPSATMACSSELPPQDPVLLRSPHRNKHSDTKTSKQDRPKSDATTSSAKSLIKHLKISSKPSSTSQPQTGQVTIDSQFSSQSSLNSNKSRNHSNPQINANQSESNPPTMRSTNQRQYDKTNRRSDASNTSTGSSSVSRPSNNYNNSKTDRK